MSEPVSMSEVRCGATSRPRVLMTLADVAWPLDAGKRLRSASMLSAVAQLCEVDVVVLFADADPALRPIPPDVTASWQLIEPLPQTSLRAGLDLLRHQLPWQISVQNWSRVQRMQAHRTDAYDLVWFGALDHFCKLRDTVRAPRMVVDCDDVETVKLARFLELPRSSALAWQDRIQRRVELPLWGRIQRQAVRLADAVLVCSEVDRVRLIAQAAGTDSAAAQRVLSVPNTYPEPVQRLPRAPRDGCSAVMVANFGTDQNLDAATFAALEVLPALRRVLPNARIRFVGRRPDRLAELAGIEGIDIVGAVESVAPELASAQFVLASIRFGGGTRLKIIEAMAHGVPVVSTRAGAEGIEVRDGHDILLADTPDQIAAAALRLVSEPGLADRLSTAAGQLYQRSYRPQASIDAVTGLLGTLLAGQL